MSEPTAIFSIHDEKDEQIREILQQVYAALKEKGYNPVNQTGGLYPVGRPHLHHHPQRCALPDPQSGRDDLLQALLRSYLGD